MTIHSLSSKPFLPVNKKEALERGWDPVDVVFVTGDAYVDHPSFAMAMLGRVLQAAGLRVGMLSQPDWRSCAPWRTFGKPRLFFAVSAGNMDSMINHYTANRKPRGEDAYSPGGKTGLRPDRATLAYCQRARQAYSDVCVIAGGVEASLRRLAHYDYWSDKVRPSILLDAKPDLLVYGMGEETILSIARLLQAGGGVKSLRNLRGVAYATGASEPRPHGPEIVQLPSYEEVASSKKAFLKAAVMAHLESNPANAKTLLQAHGRRTVVVTPPPPPVSQEQLDGYFELPFMRRPHPSYREKIPAFETIRNSVTIMRGCFGGCSFCSLSAHQGRRVTSRSSRSILRELSGLAKDPGIKGVISDLGGPTANMYAMGCSHPEAERLCRRTGCLEPSICRHLKTDHRELIELMHAARAVPGLRLILIASGVRMDLACLSPEYVRALARHHVGGHLKVAPEHVSERALQAMRKPSRKAYEEFSERFSSESLKAGKEQYLVPYFMAGHPGTDLNDMIELALFLKRRGLRPRQVQDFIPAPYDLATAMYYTGMDPRTGGPIPVARGERERKMQRALLQYFKPENHALVREALVKAGRKDLIGPGPGALVPERRGF